MTRPVDHRVTILVLVAHYPPAYLAGGPTRSVSAIVNRFGPTKDFRIITSAHELGKTDFLPGIEPNRWIGTDPRRHYVGRWWAPVRVLRAARSAPHIVLYLNSIFSLVFSFAPLLFRRMRLIPRTALVVAPRGELGEGALSLKPRRKAIYLSMLRRSGLVEDATWHATTALEAADITRAFGAGVPVVVAPNIAVVRRITKRAHRKEPGALRIAFLSRIVRKKNLRTAISYLSSLHGEIKFDIYGPIEDRRYWKEVLVEIRKLPGNVHVRYRGSIHGSAVNESLAEYDLFLLPTLGENFGYAIVEALSAGCPVLISDRTPWRDLEAKRAGWAVPLAHPDRYRSVLQTCVDMSSEEHQQWVRGAHEYAARLDDDSEIQRAYAKLFSQRIDPVAH